MKTFSKKLKCSAALAALFVGLGACANDGQTDAAAVQSEVTRTETAAVQSAPTQTASPQATSSQTGSSEAGSSQTGSNQATINGDRPAMWRLADSDSEIFLFGTFHLLPPGTQWASAVMDDAMVETETTFFEADTTSQQAQQALQQAVQQYGVNKPGVTLSSTLGAERAAKFGAVAEKYGVPLANLEPFRPWLASLTVTIVAYQRAGFDPNSGAETIITAKATEQGDEIRYLETAVDQIKALASLEDTNDFTSFDDGLKQLEDVDTEIKNLLTSWRTGDVKAMEEQLVDSIKSASPAAFDVLLKNRNANWVEQINTLMAGEGDHFIAVGAGHLVGEDSVVDMLRDRGYTVTRVQ